MTRDEWLKSNDPAAMLRWLTGRLGQEQNPGGWSYPTAPQISLRKLRLFACACVRHVWHLLTDDAECGRCRGLGYDDPLAYCKAKPKTCPDCNGTGRVNRSRRAVEAAERVAEGEITLGQGRKLVPDRFLDGRQSRGSPDPDVNGAAAWCLSVNLLLRMTLRRLGDAVPPATQADLLRATVGDPFVETWAEMAERVSGLATARRGDKIQATWVLERRRDSPLIVRRSWLTPQVLTLAQAAYEERGPRKCGRCKGKGWFYPGVEAAEDQYACAGCGRPAGQYGHYSERSKQMECPKEDCPDCHGAGNIDDGSLDPLTLLALADALEEAGCTAEALLAALRSPGPHFRGLWPLDLILGKE